MCPAPRPPINGSAPSSSWLPTNRGITKRGVLVVVQEADVTREALHNVTLEGRRWREYILVMEVALDAAN